MRCRTVIRDDNNNQSETLMAGKKRTEAEISTLKSGILERYRTSSDSLTMIRMEFNVPSNTLYNWKKKDEEFALALDFREHVSDYQLDLAEDGLATKLKEGYWLAIKYVLDMKGKERGFDNTKKIESTNKHLAIARIIKDDTPDEWKAGLKVNQNKLPTCQEDVNKVFNERFPIEAIIDEL